MPVVKDMIHGVVSQLVDLFYTDVTWEVLGDLCDDSGQRSPLEGTWLPFATLLPCRRVLPWCVLWEQSFWGCRWKRVRGWRDVKAMIPGLLAFPEQRVHAFEPGTHISSCGNDKEALWEDQ